MSLPPILKDAEKTDADWRRRVRDAVNLITRRVMDQGETTQRPKGPLVGTQFYDVTLKKPIWWDGAAWRDAGGGAV